MSEFDLGSLMQQAQQMQQQMQQMQAELEHVTVEGAAGGGMVKVTATGTQKIKSVVIDPEVMGEDREMLQDLITAAVNNALDKSREKAQEQLGSMMPPGMNIPGMPGL